MAMVNTRQSPPHTFGNKCRLAPVARPWTQKEDDIPPVHAQYFYSSPISIDDPLSSSLIAGSAESKSTRGPLRPFSRGDNNALENAWLSMADDRDRERHRIASSLPSDQVSTREPPDRESLARLIHALYHKHTVTHASSRSETPATTADVDDAAPIPVCCPDLAADTHQELSRLFCPLVRARYRQLQEDNVIQEVMMRMRAETRFEPKLSSASPERPRALSLRERDGPGARQRPASDLVGPSSLPRTTFPPSPLSKARAPLAITPRAPLSDDGVTGKLFVRMASSPADQMPPPSLFRNSEPPIHPAMREKRNIVYGAPGSPGAKPDSNPSTPRPKEGQMEVLSKLPSEDGRTRTSIQVPVGISRLHMVSLPGLQMKPIYWSPVNDVAVVLRATWFYSETMVPVDPVVANQLEAGYHELRPHTETWSDELRCAVEVGPLGEEKVVYRLWPNSQVKGSRDPEAPISRDPGCAARCYRGEAATEGRLEGVESQENQASRKPFSNYHVIYKDHIAAYLIKPSLRPSAYYGRRPVARIVNGQTVGLPVQRGFDWGVWEKVHDKRRANPPSQTGKQPASAATETMESTGFDVCQACQLDKERGQVTDLVLVAHGIGQKFAERVESFHFTHAINAFRREINIELRSPTVASVLREGQNGIMVLPVNWRHTLSFEDGGPMKEEDKLACMPEGFSLKDIEPTSIPAVRSIISDVMFDIPFYMSHHKRKMIEALVTEANRVYRLWCRNNPGFAEKGRVHFIGHSLGSAMAIEVLSKQPTQVPPLNLNEPLPQTSFFEFDTKNLFLFGSPAGFFFLLERGALTPRRGRLKPGADPLDVESEVIAGEAGFFGCLAVDNVYNILAKEDPIAYLLNATIDPTYAAGLKVAYVPSATSSVFKLMGEAVRGLVPGMQPATNSQTAAAKPPTARLPSQLELEVHDFTREEIAEKKAYLLNDNGQIDFYLRSGSGPLEIQYLNMLSAHTSYWVHQDLIRMLCIEIGREPGREHALQSLKAIKASKRIAASLANQQDG